MDDIPNSVAHLIRSIRLQTDLVTTISNAGIGFILFQLRFVRGIASDMNPSIGFRKPEWLALPLACFIVATGLGYIVIHGLVTGYFAEITNGYNATTGKRITDALQHFNDDYFGMLETLSFAQLLTHGLGIVAIAAWHINVVKSRGN